jgi:hypothetical protein
VLSRAFTKSRNESKQNIPCSEPEIGNIGNTELEIDDLQKRKKDIVKFA